ncbi:MAG: TonB-dependent receptor [Bacteroidales bacterium]|nr:TonB-dependent receptor [Bacteroidales bacterium]
MKRSFLIFITAILLQAISNDLYADGDLILKGTVKDAYNKSVIADAHIILQELNLGTTTNNRGQFVFAKLHAGSYNLVIRHIGYFEYKTEVVLDSGITQLSFLVRPRIVQIDPVNITATLTKRKVSVLPARVANIPSRMIKQLPANTTDDLLRGVANVYVHRPWGIFSKSASVTMRGLPGSARTLILLDGVPMNKAGGGSVNWNFIQPYEVKDIEIVKGPSSAIYGNNAMTGVISIKTRKPEDPLEGNVRTFGGSLGTFGAAFNLGGADFHKSSGLYWKLNGFMRKGDGYVNEPEETRDSTDSKVDLDEYGAGVLAGYRFDSVTTVDVRYRFHYGKYGTGTQVLEEDGSWDKYISHLFMSNFETRQGKYTMNARAYYQVEYFQRQNESLNSSGKYKLSDTESNKQDYGTWFNVSRKFGKNLFTAGFELKQGDLQAWETYRTSTDRVTYGGQLSFAGIFIQDEIRLFRKFSAIMGLRFDYARFRDGYQDVEDPTSATGFIQGISASFENNEWSQLSPKLALQYQVLDKLGIYASVTTGFMPPKIDDLVRSGKISKGFKIANPDLLPENIINYELGLTWMAHERVSVEPSVYYSRGYDFQYFVATGDSVETGGADLKPVLQRQNIAETEILGAEISATWKILPNLALSANYSINGSEILEFEDPTNEEKDLVGKGLIEVPKDMANASINWQNRIINVMFDWHYLGKEWYDDENTQYIEPHSVFDLKLEKKFSKGIGFSITVNNIFNDMTVDRKGKLPPGRFFMLEVVYDF